MAKVKIESHDDEYRKLLVSKEVINIMVENATNVLKEMEATAQDAQNGPGGTIAGYAESGFEVVITPGKTKRPEVRVISRAPIETWRAAYFYTIKRDGIDHMRKALRKFIRSS